MQEETVSVCSGELASFEAPIGLAGSYQKRPRLCCCWVRKDSWDEHGGARDSREMGDEEPKQPVRGSGR